MLFLLTRFSCLSHDVQTSLSEYDYCLFHLLKFLVSTIFKNLTVCNLFLWIARSSPPFYSQLNQNPNDTCFKSPSLSLSPFFLFNSAAYAVQPPLVGTNVKAGSHFVKEKISPLLVYLSLSLERQALAIHIFLRKDKKGLTFCELNTMGA